MNNSSNKIILANTLFAAQETRWVPVCKCKTPIYRIWWFSVLALAEVPCIQKPSHTHTHTDPTAVYYTQTEGYEGGGGGVSFSPAPWGWVKVFDHWSNISHLSVTLLGVGGRCGGSQSRSSFVCPQHLDTCQRLLHNLESLSRVEPGRFTQHHFSCSSGLRLSDMDSHCICIEYFTIKTFLHLFIFLLQQMTCIWSPKCFVNKMWEIL